MINTYLYKCNVCGDRLFKSYTEHEVGIREFPCVIQGCQGTVVVQHIMEAPTKEESMARAVIENPDDPYKAVIEWAQEGVKITVEAQYPGLSDLTTDEIKAECDRRAKLIVDHFKLIINST